MVKLIEKLFLKITSGESRINLNIGDHDRIHACIHISQALTEEWTSIGVIVGPIKIGCI